MAAKTGTTPGTYLHNTIENLFLRKVMESPLPDFVSAMKTHDAVKYIRARESLSELANRFYDTIIETHTPVALEFVVGDISKSIAGTFDALLYNNETGEYELWDYKTDKQLRFSNNYQVIKEFNVDDCEFEKYSIQLAIYKNLIESQTPIKISKCFIAHFDYRNSNIEVIETKNYDDKVKEYFSLKQWQL